MSEQKFGRYIIKGTLGRGAMGMVYLALDPILDRLSAIKVMNTGGEVDEGLRTRFFREAKVGRPTSTSQHHRDLRNGRGRQETLHRHGVC
jgi:serine/threonine protein kinase